MLTTFSCALYILVTDEEILSNITHLKAEDLEMLRTYRDSPAYKVTLQFELISTFVWLFNICIYLHLSNLYAENVRAKQDQHREKDAAPYYGQRWLPGRGREAASGSY